MGIILIVAFCAFFLWLGYLRGRRQAKPLTDHADKQLVVACEQWNMLLLKERTRLAEEGQITDYLTPTHIVERRRLLDTAEAFLNEGKQGGNLELRCEAMGRGMLACTQHKLSYHIDMVNELIGATQTATSANERGEKTFPAAALQKVQDLMAAPRREFDQAKAKLDAPLREHGSELVTVVAQKVEATSQAIQRAKQPLSEATAIAKALGLPTKAPPLPA